MATTRRPAQGRGTQRPAAAAKPAAAAGQGATGRQKAAVDPPLTEIQKRQRFTATAANLLSSTGPGVIICWLPRAGTNLLMRRVDLLSMVSAGELPAPLSERVAAMIRSGGLQDDQLAHERLAETVQAMRSIAVSCAIAPPPDFLVDVDISTEDLDPLSCGPLFVMPGEKAAEGQVDVSLIHLDDLREITRVAVLYGPAALSLFRRE